MNEQARIAGILYRQAVMVFLSMILSVFIYGGVCFYAVQTGHPANAVIQGGNYRLFQLGAFIIAVLALVGSRSLTGRILAGQGSGVSGDAVSPAMRHPRQIFVTETIRCAAAELPAIFGVVLLFLSRDIYGFIPFAVFALAALVFSFPRKQKWIEWLGTDF